MSRHARKRRWAHFGSVFFEIATWKTARRAICMGKTWQLEGETFLGRNERMRVASMRPMGRMHLVSQRFCPPVPMALLMIRGDLSSHHAQVYRDAPSWSGIPDQLQSFFVRWCRGLSRPWFSTEGVVAGPIRGSGRGCR